MTARASQHKPGKGFRWVKTREILRSGDQYELRAGLWVETWEAGQKCLGARTYRRRARSAG